MNVGYVYHVVIQYLKVCVVVALTTLYYEVCVCCVCFQAYAYSFFVSDKFKERPEDVLPKVSYVCVPRLTVGACLAF